MTDPRCWHDLATENAALRAENARLRQVLRNANAMIDQMCDQALACGVAGTSDWDMIAGGADIFGVQDVIRAALAHGTAHDQAPYDSEPPTMTKDKLREMIRDPRYWRDRDPALVAKVTAGYRALFPSQRPVATLHAATSPGPVNCNRRMAIQNLGPLDRCERCDGDCPFFDDEGIFKELA